MFNSEVLISDHRALSVFTLDVWIHVSVAVRDAANWCRTLNSCYDILTAAVLKVFGGASRRTHLRLTSKINIPLLFNSLNRFGVTMWIPSRIVIHLIYEISDKGAGL